MSVTGFGLREFDDYVLATRGVHEIFGRHLPEGTLTPWDPKDTAGDDILTFTNRYFSQNTSAADNVAFDENVDPDGLFTKMLSEGLGHTEDNNVTYLEEVSRVDGGPVK